MAMLTIGHGRLAASAFAALLEGAAVDLLVDVRRYPASRRHPQFGREAMTRWLDEAGVGYRWEEDLGGRRAVPEGSPDSALADPLRGYAAHLRSPAGEAAVRRLLAEAAERRVALCCAEADWRRCHRRLLADALVLLHGAEVVHVRHDGAVEPHVPTRAVRVEAGRLLYDRGAGRRLPGF